MSNYKTVFFTLGVLQIILGISMMIPILAQFIYSELDSSFIGASIVSIIFGVLFFLTNLNHDKKLNLQQAFLLTALSWLSIAILNQERAVNKNACCKFNFLSWFKFVKKNKTPNIIETIEAPIKEESSSE